MPEAAEAPLRTPASPGELFRVFTRMSLMGFGGVLPIAQYMLVEKQRWMTREQFVETLSIGQVLPGPNIINVVLMVGDRFFGWRGAAAALAGIIGAPLVLVLALAALYAGFAHVPAVAGALRGMGAVSAGLIVATGLKLLPTLSKSPLGKPACAIVALLTFVAVGFLRVPMVWVVGVVGGGSLAFAWWKLGR
jgi:chromate transporter